MFPELIQATIMNKEVLESCWENASGDCLKTNGNPLGLPIERKSCAMPVFAQQSRELTSSSPLRLFIDLFCPEFFGHNGGNPLGAQCAKFTLQLAPSLNLD